MADKKLRVLCTVYPRQEKNEDGDLVNRNYYEGDVVTVRSSVAEVLLAMESGGRRLFREVEEAKSEETTTKSASTPTPAPAAKSVPAAPASNDK